MKSESNAGIIIWVIFIIALVLRLWGTETMPFFYDEVSAVLRGRHSTWHDHIAKGIIPDGHPPFVQTFIWIFIRFFGENSYILKTFSAILGALAVYFTFKSGKILFHTQAGLIAASLLAVAYLPVFWSQQVRPYSFGMASATALLWLFASITTHKSAKLYHFILFGLLTALNCYIHYFAGLSAIAIGIALMVSCYKKYTKYLLISITIAILTLLPAYPVFYHQFRNKGLGWLGKPDVTFFAQHLFVVFSKSWIFIFSVIVVMVVFIRQAGLNFTAKNNLLIMALLFCIPLATGYLYSIYRAPVLQHSVLLFSMPFLFLIFGGISKAVSKKIQYAGIAIVFLAGIYALTIENKYYSVVQKEPYSQIILKYLDNNKTDHSVFYFDGAHDVAEFHLGRILKGNSNKNAIESGSFQYLFPSSEGFKPKTIYTLAESNRPISLGLISGSNPFIIPMFEDLLGKATNRHYFLGGEYLEFSTKQHSTAVKYQRHYLNQSSHKINATTLNAQKNDMIFFRFSPNLFHVQGEIQTAIMCDGNQIDWRSSNLADFYSEKNHLGYHVIKLADIPAWTENCEIHVSVKSQNTYLDGLMEYRVCPGNPYMYEVK